MSVKTQQTVENRQARLTATKERVAHRNNKAQDRIARLEQRMEKLKAQLEAAKAKAPAIKAQGEALIERQSKALGEAQTRHERSECLEQEKQHRAQERAARKAASKPAATVESEDGSITTIDKDAADKIRSIIGTHKSGILEPLDGKEAQAVLDALGEAPGRGTCGDVFEVRFRGRRTSLLFTIEENGLRFLTVNNRVAVA